MGLFSDKGSAEVLVDELPLQIKAPVVSAYISRLGGADRPSVMLFVGLDPRETWMNGIAENSRYFKMSIDSDGEMEVHSDSGVKGRAGMMEHVALLKRFRKTKAKSLPEVIKKINKYIAEVDGAGAAPTSHGRYGG